jgi:predicted component of viral defense system (DUF524 family)
LELKDVALLYEVWCYFVLVQEMEKLLGPARPVDLVKYGGYQATVQRGLAVRWDNGVLARYNASFSPAESGKLKSYSLLVRPDIVIIVPLGANSGVHVFDAKFKVDKVQRTAKHHKEESGETEIALEDTLSELEGIVTRGDIHTMHMYRDSIIEAKTAWTLYPGTKFRFYDTDLTNADFGAVSLPSELRGVGAIPLLPQAKPYSDLNRVLAAILADPA